jgi:hypothetical protein
MHGPERNRPFDYERAEFVKADKKDHPASDTGAHGEDPMILPYALKLAGMLRGRLLPGSQRLGIRYLWRGPDGHAVRGKDARLWGRSLLTVSPPFAGLFLTAGSGRSMRPPLLAF